MPAPRKTIAGLRDDIWLFLVEADIFFLDSMDLETIHSDRK